MMGRVVDAKGRGIPAASILRCPWGESSAGGVDVILREGKEFVCDQLGRYAIPAGDWQGRSAWVVRAAGYRLHCEVGARVREEVVLIDCEPLRVEVTLDGDPYAGARVLWSGEIAPRVRTTLEATTGSSGAAPIAGVKGGAVRVALPIPGVRVKSRPVDAARILFEFASALELVVKGSDGESDHDSSIALVSRQTGHVRWCGPGPVIRLTERQAGWPGLDAVAWSAESPPVRRRLTSDAGALAVASPLELKLEKGSTPRLTVLVSCPKAEHRARIQVELEFDDALLETRPTVVASRTGSAPGKVEFANLPKVRLRGAIIAEGSTIAWFEVEPDQTSVECEISSLGSLTITDQNGDPPPVWAEVTIGNLRRSIWRVVRDAGEPTELPPGNYLLWPGVYQKSEVVNHRASVPFTIREGEASRVRVPFPIPVKCIVRARGALLDEPTEKKLMLRFEHLGERGLPAWHRSRSTAPGSDAWREIPVTPKSIRQGVPIRLEPGLYRAELRLPHAIDSRACKVEPRDKQLLTLDFTGATRTVRVVEATTLRPVQGAHVLIGRRDGSWSMRTTNASGSVSLPAFAQAGTTIDVTAEAVGRSTVVDASGRGELVIPIGPVPLDLVGGAEFRLRLQAPAGARIRSVYVRIFAIERADSGVPIHRFARESAVGVGATGLTDSIRLPRTGKYRLGLWVYDRMDLVGEIDLDGAELQERATIPVKLTER